VILFKVPQNHKNYNNKKRETQGKSNKKQERKTNNISRKCAHFWGADLIVQQRKPLSNRL